MAFGHPTVVVGQALISKPASAPANQQLHPTGEHNIGAPPQPSLTLQEQATLQARVLLRHQSLVCPNGEGSVEKKHFVFEQSGPPRVQETFQQENRTPQSLKPRNQGLNRLSIKSGSSQISVAGRKRTLPTAHLNSGARESFKHPLQATYQPKRPDFKLKAHVREDPSPSHALSPAPTQGQSESTGVLESARRKVSSAEKVADLGICDYNWLDNWTRRFASEWNSQSSFKLRPNQIEETIAEAHQLLVAEGLLGRRVSEVFDDVAAWLGSKFCHQNTTEFETKAESSTTDYSTSNMPAPSVPGAQLGQFLVLVNGFVQHKNEDGLSNCVRIEPPFLNEYATMINELHQLYPKGSESALEDECRRVLSAAREGVDGSGTWTPFILFMVQYLVYLRDYQDGTEHILETFDRLSLLQKRANSALNHTLGYLMLHIVVTSARFVSYLAITLDKNPQMLRNRNKASTQDEGSQAESLAEGAVNNLRDAFNTCATDRLAHVDSNGKPDGRKRGIYLIANICLKILFQCRKTNNATTFFDSIDTHSPPLSAYPKSQRVTYLYYLGRFHFQHSHFYRAYLALQQAHNESPTDQRCVGQRRLILIYLMASSIICGRLPTTTLFQHLPEAQGIYHHFEPLLSAIRSGNLAGFRRHMDYNSPHAAFFLKYRIFLQLRNRCEVLVWRSLVRKTWMLTGTRFDPTAGSNAPLIDGSNLLNAFYILEKQVQDPAEVSYINSDFDGADIQEDAEALLPTATSIRSILSSLIEQGLIRGFIHTKSGKFVITGVKQHNGSELAAGFPSPWKVIENRANKDVPGWKRDGSGAHGGGGKVIHLSGARAIGA